MAHSSSAKKRIRQNEKRRLLNRRRQLVVKTAVKEFNSQLTEDATQAGEKLSVAYKRIDQLAAKGIIHKKTAARRKSALAQKLNAAASA